VRYDGVQDLGPNTAEEDHYVKGSISNIHILMNAWILYILWDIYHIKITEESS
jgi:hypothetical protein